MTQEENNGSDMNRRDPKEGSFSKLWVLVVILIGAGAGLVLYSLTFANIQFFPFVPERVLLEFKLYEEFHIILSTVGISLLVALIVVYANTFKQTRASFILGLLIVLFALLLQAVLDSPVYLALVSHVAFYPELSSPIADIFMIVAYAVFLYLSLE